MENNTMKIEIWSDVMCPFCYIGKRKFEAALDQLKDKKDIEIEWKSFQLSPDMTTNPDKNIHQYLAEHKGISLEEAKKMNNYVTEMAKNVGLDYHFEKAIVANSMMAHRFLHFSKTKYKQNEAEELLFKSYFTDGKNTDDLDTLIDLGKQLELDVLELTKVLKSNEFENDVKADIQEAQELGINGVPFFVFDRKYAISGAQETELFINTLQTAYQEWEMDNSQNRVNLN